ncbi:phosphopantothenoylcysteine decarboxylase isoform X2 [Nematostella vectensis]|uniref:phosphopantothenoylcysteine decarboxylase isoform X2 n=1 Tax=Nematostella vectensis TaxID=45351 RepID=UPI00207774AF|nr:phosphopantothenoylcysteine decarboxylase isoform X2 [Nematostella vectensis]
MADDAEKNLAKNFNVLVGVTGSVAAIKLQKLVNELLSFSNPKIALKIVATENSMHFFNIDDIPIKVYRDQDEWQTWSSLSDPVLHIETCIVRAWDTKKTLLFCPAMNTYMWEHPLTSEHIERLCRLGYVQIFPISKKLACGDVGVGAMAEVETIVSTVLKHLNK